MSVEGEGDWSQPEFASEYRFSCFFFSNSRQSVFLSTMLCNCILLFVKFYCMICSDCFMFFFCHVRYLFL